MSPSCTLPVGLVKLSTLGLFFIGQLLDFLLILVQAVGPADRSEYYAPFYGPLITAANTTNPYPEVANASCL